MKFYNNKGIDNCSIVDYITSKDWNITDSKDGADLVLAMLEYHFNFVFPDFEDTMLLHYCLDEVPGGHGLKQLAMKFTPYGDYEKPMYDWMDD